MGKAGKQTGLGDLLLVALPGAPWPWGSQKSKPVIVKANAARDGVPGPDLRHSASPLPRNTAHDSPV
jgi:hypothetical protein